jgi:nitroimidazol reductase NimA-like FMN-containing flavoprotein (pyridoxamine 5'-phosphate oxidase superfamily)
MRRKEKEIQDRSEIESVIERSVVCRLAMCDGMQPYIVPLNFGYRGNALYFHTGLKGKKVEILRKNNRVCFEMEMDVALVPGERACEYGMTFLSVIGTGTAVLVEEVEAKRRALDILMNHYSVDNRDYDDKALKKTLIIRVDIQEMTGKKSGFGG